MLGTGNVHPRTGHEGFEGEMGHSNTLRLCQIGGGWSMPCLGCFTPGKRPRPHRVGAWVGPTACPDGCGKSHHDGDLIPGLSSPYEVAIQTTL